MAHEVPSVYRELAAPAARSHLLCCWSQVVSGDAAATQLVVPDGAADVIVDADDRAMVVGPSALAEAVHIPAGTQLAGIRFRPGAIGSALRIPAGELEQQTVELDRVVAPRFARQLIAAVHGNESAWQWLENRWDTTTIDPRVRAVLNGYDEAGAGWSKRQVRRLFHEHAGLSPRAMLRVLRFQHFLRLAEGPSSHLGLADLAYAAGYFDQPHLNREVRALTGFAPRELLRRRTSGADASNSWPERTRRASW